MIGIVGDTAGCKHLGLRLRPYLSKKFIKGPKAPHYIKTKASKISFKSLQAYLESISPWIPLIDLMYIFRKYA